MLCPAHTKCLVHKVTVGIRWGSAFVFGKYFTVILTCGLGPFRGRLPPGPSLVCSIRY